MFNFDGNFPQRIASDGGASNSKVLANDLDASDFFDCPKGCIDRPIPLFHSLGELLVPMLQR